MDYLGRARIITSLMKGRQESELEEVVWRLKQSVNM